MSAKTPAYVCYGCRSFRESQGDPEPRLRKWPGRDEYVCSSCGAHWDGPQVRANPSRFAPKAKAPTSRDLFTRRNHAV